MLAVKSFLVAALLGLMFLLTGCGLLHPGSSSTPFAKQPAVTGNNATATALKPAITTNTNELVEIPHLTLVWNNNYNTNADGSTLSNEITNVQATDSLGKPNWQLVTQTRDGFAVIPNDRPQRFFRVANIIQ